MEEVDVDDAQADVPVKVDLMEEVMQEDEEAISSGISALTDAGMVDAGLSKALTSMHQQTFRRVVCSALPVYERRAHSEYKESHYKKTPQPICRDIIQREGYAHTQDYSGVQCCV